MAYTSARLNLPLLQAGQAQKEFTHNEALAAIEPLVQPVAQTLGDNVPPASPLDGQCWIVGTAPSGGWAGQAGALAMWTDGGWRFTPAFDGMAIWVAAVDLGASSVGYVGAGRRARTKPCNRRGSGCGRSTVGDHAAHRRNLGRY